MKNKKIKIFCIIGVLLLCFFSIIALASCNMQLVDLNYNFNKVHVFETNMCYEIESWKDYENRDQIQVEIKDYGTCVFHSNQIVLISGKCPFCSELEGAKK